MRTGIERITRRQFYALGGFTNSALFRRDRGRGWSYYHDRRRASL